MDTLARYRRLRTAHLEQAAAPRDWIWDGFVAPGQITLFTALWKSGKTTLLSHLLAQRARGGILIDRAVTAGASVILSEETPTLWHERNLKLGFGPGDSFFCRPFVAAPTLPEWLEFLDILLELRRTEGIDLVIVDPLVAFLPTREENNAKLMFEALSPFRRLTDAGVAVLLAAHPSKAAAQDGRTTRGSGALPAFADILVEMHPFNAERSEDRRRRLKTFSRFAESPRSLLIELSADATQYERLDELPDDDFSPNWPVLRLVMEDARRELSRQEIQKQWPPDYPAPKPTTLWRWLDRAVEQNLLARAGAGRRTDPFRYYLAEKMDQWRNDPLFNLSETLRNQPKMPWEEGYRPEGIGEEC